jgi:tetratricopeptide (TPR) repeat protein
LEAKNVVDRAVDLQPNYASAHVIRSVIYLITDRAEEAIREDRIAIELDPLSLIAQWNAIWALRVSGRYDEALAQARRAAALDSSATLLYAMMVHIHEVRDDYEAALDLLDKYLPEADGGKAAAARLREAYRARGARGYWETSIAALEAREAGPTSEPEIALAAMYCRIGQKAKALGLLERAYARHSSDMLFIGLDPALRVLADEPRYRTLLRRIGLPEPPRS